MSATTVDDLARSGADPAALQALKIPRLLVREFLAGPLAICLTMVPRQRLGTGVRELTAREQPFDVAYPGEIRAVAE